MIDKIYHMLKVKINEADGKIIPVKKLLSHVEGMNNVMPVYLQSPDGQEAFSAAVAKLVQEQLVSPVGKKPNIHHSLYLKYRINRTPEQDSSLATEAVKCITLPAKVDYYLRHTDDFLKDKPVIEVLINFLKNNHKEQLTINERAYQLFGDEKFFHGDDKARSRGETVLKRLGLDYSDLDCSDTLEPFFSFQMKDFHLNRERKIYIIENKDTFWSFKRNVMDYPSVLDPDMLIYGEGKKIISSFRFVDEYGLHADADTFFYFGDLDAEGVSIYFDLVEKYSDYKIIPFIEGYREILESGLKHGLHKTPKRQSVSAEKLQFFLSVFSQSDAEKIRELLEGGCYIPQEALCASRMKERFARV